jgi:hypothetical protein
MADISTSFNLEFSTTEENIDTEFKSIQQANMEYVQHNSLQGRDAADSHPIDAISNLSTELSKKANTTDVPTKVSQLTNDTGFITDVDNTKVVHLTGDESIDGIKSFNSEFKAAKITDTENFAINATNQEINFLNNKVTINPYEFTITSNGDTDGTKTFNINPATLSYGTKFVIDSSNINFLNNTHRMSSDQVSLLNSKVFMDDTTLSHNGVNLCIRPFMQQQIGLYEFNEACGLSLYSKSDAKLCSIQFYGEGQKLSGGIGLYDNLGGEYNGMVLEAKINNVQTPIKHLYDIPDTSNDRTIATTSWVTSKIAALVNSAPTTLDTLNELATALGDDPNFATTIATEIGKKANTIDVPTKVSQLTNDTGFITSTNNITGNAATATKASQDASGNVITDTYLPKAGGTMTGGLTLSGAPTADLHAATKAYVDTAISGVSESASAAKTLFDNTTKHTIVVTYEDNTTETINILGVNS